MSNFVDPEFGEIVVHKRRGSRSVRIRIGTDGRYTATIPPYTPIFYVKQVINGSRDELRALARETSHSSPYIEGQEIGKSHKLAVVNTQMVTKPTVTTKRQVLLVQLPPDSSLELPAVQQLVRDEVTKILRKEARAYLPRRLKWLAEQHGFSYVRVRFSHAGGRWGSCSSNGTISLNIALMKLPHELIDYVLVHELCHTRYMNHSPHFWKEVEEYDPLYRVHRQRIKRETPSV